MQLVNEVWATEVSQVVVGGKQMGASVQIRFAKILLFDGECNAHQPLQSQVGEWCALTSLTTRWRVKEIWLAELFAIFQLLRIRSRRPELTAAICMHGKPVHCSHPHP